MSITNVQIKLQYEEPNTYAMEPHSPGCDCTFCDGLSEVWKSAAEVETNDYREELYQITQQDIDDYADSMFDDILAIRQMVEAKDEYDEDVNLNEEVRLF